MSDTTQEKIKPLSKQEVKVALVLKGWTQAMLAQQVGKSLTTVNLAINHNTFPEVTKRIRKILAL